MKKALTQTKQCKNCPWKINSNTSKIPGYSRDQHKQLEKTIAVPEQFGMSCNRWMACHDSTEGSDLPCTGWLHNQLGVGNNIGLRISMMEYSNAGEIEVFGEQHQRFQDTLKAK